MSEPLTVDAGATATLRCEADANPTPEDVLTWTRPGYDLAERTALVSEHPGGDRGAGVGHGVRGMIRAENASMETAVAVCNLVTVGAR